MVRFSQLKNNTSPSKKPSSPQKEKRKYGKSRVRFSQLDGETNRRPAQSVSNQIAVNESDADERRDALYRQAHDYLTRVFTAVKNEETFELEEGFEIIGEVVEIQTSNDSLFLNAIYWEDASNYVVHHSVNVAVFSIILAGDLGYNMDRRIEIGMVALLHEVGAARIPDDLLYKKDTLSPKEYAVLKQRPNYGYEVLKQFKDRYPYLAECALQVYEKIDGSGYPRGLKGDEIHEYAQIVGLVDVYEALIHSRPQREKFLHFNAVKEIIKTGKKKYQSRYLKALLNIFSVFPLQSYVRLNSGAVGQVVETYRDQPLRPKIRILYDSQKRKVLTERIINLPEDPLLFIVDSISEDELLALSEASEFITRSAASEDKSGRISDSDARFRIGSGKSGMGHPATRIRNRQRTSGFRGMKIAVLAGLIICLGLVVVWQMRSDGWESTGTVPMEPVKIAESPAVSDRKAMEPDDTRDQALKKATETTIQPGTWDDRRKTPSDLGKLESGNMETGHLDKAVANASISVNAGLTEDTGAAEKTGGQATVADHENSKKRTPDGVPDMVVAEMPFNSAAAVTQKAGNSPGENTVKPVTDKPRFPFSIKLTYFRTREEAEKSLSAFRENGLNPYWVKVNLGSAGIWYRVFTGHFTTVQQAEDFIKRHQLSGVAIKKTRFAVLIGTFSDETDTRRHIDALQQAGYSPYIIRGDNGRSNIYVGAFYTRQGAQDQVADLDADGIAGRIVER